MSDKKDVYSIQDLTEILKKRDYQVNHVLLCKELLKYMRRHYSDTHPRVLKAERMLKDSINAINWI